MAGAGEGSGFKPPYMAFQTFWRFIDELSGPGLPPVIDRSLMSSKSGTDQANLVTALRSFNLINDDNTVNATFNALVTASGEERKQLLRELVQTYYQPQLAVSAQNGTEQQLNDSFRNGYGIVGADTLRKSVTFFLHASREAGIALSQHFPNTRSGSGAPGQARAKARAKPRKKAPATPVVPPAPPPTANPAVNVRLQTGGTLQLLVDVNPITLVGEDREFFFKVLDLLTEYSAAHPQTPPAASAADGDDSGDDSEENTD
ncbi:hypothetical protein [Mycobacteroides abscessus]|uniref:DUF5343 domain-containing protein n=1 Tax=Mycobacteroides abscessus TaxID=36809 RepID=A0A0U0ZSH9_9MYCO|nr:hypothetical protein [Mycobacteroides abscessus]CPV65748.1 Uncharacterised protein [Mycobacteroides abscessus]